MAHKKKTESISKLRKNLRRMYRQYRAMQVFANFLSADERKEFDAMIEEVDLFEVEALQRLTVSTQKQISDFIEKFGLMVDPDKLCHFLNANQQPGTVTYFPKWLFQTLFSKYGEVHTFYNRLPPHGRIGIDILSSRPVADRMEWASLEASLFEDMAIMWNETISIRTCQKHSVDEISHSIKLESALMRSVTKAAFGLLEGYLNGLAFDVLLLRETSQKEKELLLEYSEGRFRPLSLKDKIRYYLRFASGKPHPPLNESNSKNLCFVLRAEKALRHALIHPTPRFEDVPIDNVSREITYSEIDYTQVAELIDAVIGLIKESHSNLDSRFGDVDWWLFPREESGLFPFKAFL